MVAGISQTIMLLLRLLVNFKTCLHCNLEFILVTFIVDAFVLLMNARLKAALVMIWYSQWFSQWICTKNIYSQIPFGLSQSVLWKKVSQSFYSHIGDSICPRWIELSFIILFYQCWDKIFHLHLHNLITKSSVAFKQLDFLRSYRLNMKYTMSRHLYEREKRPMNKVLAYGICLHIYNVICCSASKVFKMARWRPWSGLLKV